MIPYVTSTVAGPLTAVLRDCWVSVANLRVSSLERKPLEERCGCVIHAVVIESVKVEEQHRNQGHFRRYIESVQKQSRGRFDIVIVEAVQNPILADALMRWGWGFDSGVMDFYWRVRIPRDA